MQVTAEGISSMQRMGKNVRPPWGPLLGFGALFVAFFVACNLYYLNQHSTIKKGIHQELATIADLKVQQISQWFREHTSQALILARNIRVADSVQVQPAEAGAAWGEAGVLSLMRAVRELHGYQNIMLFDAGGSLRLSAMPGQWAPPDSAACKRALSAGLPVISDLVLDARNEIYLDIIVPLPPGTDAGSSLRPGLVVARSRPQDFLYPLIQSWPTPSSSAETLLVRREGDEILYLNNLRHRGDTAMKLRAPIQEKSLPGALFSRGGKEVREGIDYRGIPVLWAAREVPGTPWLLVAKVDSDEILEPLRRQALAAGLVLGLLTLGAVLFAFGLWNRRQAPDLSTAALMQEALQQSEEKFRSVVEQSLVGIMLCDAGGRIIVWNRGLEGITLLPRDEALGRFVWDVEYDLLPGETRSPGMYETFAAGMRSAFASNENFNTRGPYEFVIQRRDGIRICIQDIRFPIQTAGGLIWAGMCYDITARKQTEDALRESEARLKSSQELAHLGDWEFDVKTGRTHWSDEMYRLLGYAPGEITPSLASWISCMHPQDQSTPLMDIASSRQGTVERAEFRVVRKDGLVRYMLSEAWLVCDESGSPLVARGIMQDITASRAFERELEKHRDHLDELVKQRTAALENEVAERRRTEAELRQSEIRFKSIAESAHDAIMICNEDMKLIYWNDAAARVFGYSAKEMLGETHEILIIDKGQEEIEHYVASYRATGVTPFEDQLFEVAARRKDGTIVQVAMSGASWSVGEKTYYSVIARDMSQYKKADEALRESEQRFRALAEACPDAIVMADERWTIVYFNAAAERIFGYTRQEVLGRSSDCLMSPTGWQKTTGAAEELYKEGHTHFTDGGFVEIVAYRKSGEVFPCELAVFHWLASSMPTGIMGIIVRDITQRKRSEEALRESEERFRAFAETSPDAMVMCDENQAILYWNAGAERIFGYTGQEMLGRTPDCLMPPAPMQRQRSAIEKLDREGSARILDGVTETAGLRKSGEEFPCELMVFHWVTSGMPKGIVGVILRDITQRKRAEEALRESQEKLAGIISAVTAFMVMVDEDFRIVWANEHALQTFGRDILGKMCHEAYHGLDRPCEHCNVRGCFASGLPAEYEQVITAPDGRQLDLWCTTSIAARHEDGSPKHLVHISYDITERKKMQAEALRASHLASIGELAAGVAHEINNPINGIINCADILKHQFEKTGQDADVPCRIIREGERVAAIVKNLLTFAQERKRKIEPQDVRSIYADAFDLFAKQFEKHFIITRYDFPEDIPRVLAQHQQIQQVFLNLLSNARYALNKKYPDKDPDKLLEVTARAISIEGQPFVRIAFHDHGTGAPAGELEKLCNPFYSTKPAGEGTGLGLSISYNIIKDHGGRLQFETSEGHYMRVVVDLPAAE
jgi:PAS domain S-box-containing protein